MLYIAFYFKTVELTLPIYKESIKELSLIL